MRDALNIYTILETTVIVYGSNMKADTKPKQTKANNTFGCGTTLG